MALFQFSYIYPEILKKVKFTTRTSGISQLVKLVLSAQFLKLYLVLQLLSLKQPSRIKTEPLLQSVKFHFSPLFFFHARHFKGGNLQLWNTLQGFLRIHMKPTFCHSKCYCLQIALGLLKQKREH